MINKDNVAWDRFEFSVISITKISSPYEITDEPWYQYVIGRSDDCIKGMCQGTLEEVTEHADCIVTDLNERRNVKMGPMWRTKKPPLNTAPK